MNVYQLCAWHRLSVNTSWTLQRSLMRSIQGHVSKAHSSSNTKALNRTICCWSGEPCSVIILLVPVKRPCLWGLIQPCQEGVTMLRGLPCDHRVVNGPNLFTTWTLKDTNAHTKTDNNMSHLATLKVFPWICQEVQRSQVCGETLNVFV